MQQFFQSIVLTFTLLNKQRKNPKEKQKAIFESYVKNTLEKGYKFLF